MTLLLRALLAAALGLAVGWEREAHGHAAGVRTVSLVTMAAAALTALSQSSFPGSADRILANIIVSVGFLGAGMILRGQRGEPHGLTTAASVWSMTIVGMVVGLGHYLPGIILTGIILFLLWWQYIPWLARLLPPPVPPIERPLRRRVAHRATTPPTADSTATASQNLPSDKRDRVAPDALGDQSAPTKPGRT